MTLKIAINGFGRIGRLVTRALYESHRQDIQLVAINDLGTAGDNAHLLTYDSVHGRFPLQVGHTPSTLTINGTTVQALAQPEPRCLPWKDMGIDVVLECSGRFTDYADAAQHIEAGAQRVLISAPATHVTKTIVFGVNHDTLTSQDVVVSNASCTTNCLAPVAAVLHQAVGIEQGYMTTIHAYTGDQRLVDTLHKDLHRARAAATSMIPTSTGAAKAVGLVLPALKGKLDGMALRVPTANVSVVDFTFTASRTCTVDDINAALTAAASHGPLQGILTLNSLPLVSMDFNHNPASAIVDLPQTQVVNGTFVRVMAWYDNEWGFSNRMLDTAAVMGKHLA